MRPLVVVTVDVYEIDRAVQAAMVAYTHKPSLHYTRGGARCDVIAANRRNARAGQFPDYADCSAYATWCLWNGLALIFHRPDVVNGETSRAGYGGTMLGHGKQQTVGNCLPGDVVIYGHRFRVSMSR